MEDSLNYDGSFGAAIEYFNGENVTRDYDKAFKLFSQAGLNKVVKAYYYLGLCYENGYGVVTNDLQAILWYKNGAESGCGKSLLALGKLYFKLGHKEDAIQTLSDESLSNNREALMILAELYENDNEVKFLETLEKACGLGVEEAYYKLGIYYLHRDKEKSLQLLSSAYDLGFLEAALTIAKEYYHDNNGMAYEWLLKAHNAGIKEASYLLADSLHKGIGVTRNDELAKNVLEYLVVKNDTKAITMLANMYMEIDTTFRDEALGRYWYEKAANLGDVEAMLVVADCYLTGIGCSVEEKTAYMWYEKAASLGDDKAKEMLIHFKKSLFGDYKYQN